MGHWPAATATELYSDRAPLVKREPVHKPFTCVRACARARGSDIACSCLPRCSEQPVLGPAAIAVKQREPRTGYTARAMAQGLDLHGPCAYVRGKHGSSGCARPCHGLPSRHWSPAGQHRGRAAPLQHNTCWVCLVGQRDGCIKVAGGMWWYVDGGRSCCVFCMLQRRGAVANTGWLPVVLVPMSVAREQSTTSAPPAEPEPEEGVGAGGVAETTTRTTRAAVQLHAPNTIVLMLIGSVVVVCYCSS